MSNYKKLTAKYSPPHKRRERKGSANPDSKFGYDYSDPGAIQGEDGHYFSRNPETGKILKGRRHPTIRKTKKAERKLGYKITRKKGVLYSNPKTNGRD